MKQSEVFRQSAKSCAHLAESAPSETLFRRYKRIEAAWLALAHEQDWLDGEVSPTRPSPAHEGGSAAAESWRTDAGSQGVDRQGMTGETIEVAE